MEPPHLPVSRSTLILVKPAIEIGWGVATPSTHERTDPLPLSLRARGHVYL